MAARPRSRLAVGLVGAVAIVAASCGDAPVTTSPAASGLPGGASPSAASSSSAPGSGSPIVSPAAVPSGGAAPAPAPLPEPTLRDAFAIGEALYDPTRQADAVVSLLDLLEVGIYAADGAPIRPGGEVDADDLWLTDDEVRGLIAIGEEDAAAFGEEGGGIPMTVADLHAALVPMLPADFSAVDFAGAYDAAYQQDPDELIAQVLFNQPIAPDTPLTRTQAWFLYVDGFVAPTGLHAPRSAMAGTGSARPVRGERPAIGQVRMPTLSWMGSPWQASELAMVLAHLQLLGHTIPFEIRPLPVLAHEGHGGEGSPIAIRAVQAFGSWSPFVSPMTGQPLVMPRPTLLDGLTVTWDGVGALERHGTVDLPPTRMIETDAAGAATMTFTPRREPADGRGEETTETVSLRATVDVRELVLQHYDIPIEAFGLVTGTRTVTGPVIVTWHDDGLQIDLVNDYTGVQIVLGSGFALGSGTDEAHGFLARLDDGTYRGTIDGEVGGSFEGAALGAECADSFSGTQQLLAIGTPDALDQTVSLRFYPASAPSLSTGSCTIAIPFPGGGQDAQPAGSFLPFNDTRWTTQNGLRIDVPSTGTLQYGIPSPPGLKGSSTWDIEVERVDATP